MYVKTSATNIICPILDIYHMHTQTIIREISSFYCSIPSSEQPYSYECFQKINTAIQSGLSIISAQVSHMINSYSNRRLSDVKVGQNNNPPNKSDQMKDMFESKLRSNFSIGIDGEDDSNSITSENEYDSKSEINLIHPPLKNNQDQLSGGYGEIAMKYGRDNEETARLAYGLTIGKVVEKPDSMSANLEYKLTGMCDGLILDGQGKLLGVLEIKCPYQLRLSTHPVKFSRLSYMVDGTLRKTHAYYAQVQKYILLYKVSWCDFFIWTPVETLTVRIFRDEGYLNSLLRNPKAPV